MNYLVRLGLGLFLGAAGFGAAAQAPAPAWQEALAIGQGRRQLEKVAADSLGNVYITGWFAGSTTFGATTLAAAPEPLLYLAKWNDATHRYGWVLPLGTVHDLTITGLVVNGPAIYLAGYFGQQLRLGDTTLLASQGGRGFVARLTDQGSAGRVQWVRQPLSTQGEAFITSLAVRHGALYVAGPYQGTLSLGHLQLARADSSNLFVAKLADAAGTGRFVWARPVSSPAAVRNPVLAVAGESVFMAAEFEQAVTLGRLSLTNETASSTSFIAKILDTGPAATFTWAERLGNSAATRIGALAAAGDSVYVAGESTDYVWFGQQRQLAATGQTTFLLKLRDAGPAAQLVWRRQIRGTSGVAISHLLLHGSYLYLGGLFEGTSVFDYQQLTSAVPPDHFLARLRDRGASGRFDWVQRLGGKSASGLGTNNLNSLTIASTGTLYVAATLEATATLGARPILRRVPPGFNDYLLRFRLPR